MSLITATMPVRRTTRRVPAAYSYGPLTRVADWWSAHRDLDSDPELFIRRMVHTRAENDIRLLAKVKNRLSGSVQKLTAAHDQLRAPVETIEPSALRRDIAHRGEVHLSPEAVQSRRAREHDRAVRAAADREDATRQRRTALARQVDELKAEVVEEWELACVVSERLRHYYMRRTISYARVQARRGVAVRIPDFEPAPWTTQPCPWIIPTKEG